MTKDLRCNLAHDLILPAILFAALGGMTWAVRGSSGFGAMKGCIFAGVMWGTAWWFIAREPGGRQTRRYSSGWIILALTVGIGISGARGWMQWPSFFEGHLQTNTAKGEFVPISRTYGFLWLFIAGVPWAGLGACMLAWCGPERPTAMRHWVIRIACGLGLAWLAGILFDRFPEVFLPLYKSMTAQYADLNANPNLRRLMNDNRAAITHLGLYAGFLGYEIGRKDWKNVVLILAVGLTNGIGWSLCQNWKWAQTIWPDASFNFWRCWESSGGISIGLAYGLAYFVVNRRRPESKGDLPGSPWTNEHPNLERLGAYAGLVIGLGLSLKNGLKGWANIYLGHEAYWERVLWNIIAPLMVLTLLALAVRIRMRPLPKRFQGDVFPHASRLVWMVLIMQNVLAQLVTGPPTAWNEIAFSLYYLLLFALTGVIVFHFQSTKARDSSRQLVDS